MGMTPAYSVPDGTHRSRGPALSVEGLVALYCIGSTMLPLVSPAFKALPYANPFMCLIGALATRRLSMPLNAPPYFVLVVVGLATAPFGNLRGLQDCWLMLAGLSPLLFGYRYKLDWNAFFVVTCCVTVASIAGSLGRGGIVFDPLNSVSTFESSTSFLFGIAAMWAAAQKRWGRVLLSLLLTILTLKRIVVLAAIVAIVAMILPRKVVDKLLRPIPMLCFNALIVGLAIAYAHGQLDQLIHRFTGQSPDQFGMGRQFLYQGVVRALVKDPWDFIFHGLGPGGAYNLIGIRGETNQNLHNDSLKILVEYGFIVWVAFFYLLYRPKQMEIRAMMLFTNILLLTDNTLIYAFVICPTSLAIVAMTTAKDDVPLMHRPLRSKFDNQAFRRFGGRAR